jgi:hypothetical protein
MTAAKGLGEAFGTWRRWWREEWEFLRLRRRLRRELPWPEAGQEFCIHELLARVSEQRGRRVRAVPVAPEHGRRGGPATSRGGKEQLVLYGELVVKPTEDQIRYDEETKGVQRWAIILHELLHLLLGHASEQRREWFPDLDPAFVERQLARTTYDHPHDRLAERGATWALTLALDGRAVGGRAWQRMRRWRPRVAVEAARRWLAHYRAYRGLRPLWRALVQAMPDVALHPPGGPLAELLAACNPGYRVSRMVVEICDAQRLLLPWMDSQVPGRVREAARCVGGLPGVQADAVVDAAMLVLALQARQRDATAAMQPVRLACAADVDVHHELSRLQGVAEASKGLIVRTFLAEDVTGRGAAPRRARAALTRSR